MFLSLGLIFNIYISFLILLKDLPTLFFQTLTRLSLFVLLLEVISLSYLYIYLPAPIYLIDGLILISHNNISIFIIIIFLFSLISSTLTSSLFRPDLILFLLTNLSATFFLLTSHDLIPFLISFELFNFSSYLILSSLLNHEASLAASLKYFLLSSFFTALLLIAFLLFYLLTASTHFDAIALLLIYSPYQPLLILATILLISTFLFKLAAAPFHLYSPDLYATLPLPLALFFFIIPKLVFIYLLNQFLTLFHLLSLPYISHFILFCALLSLLIASIQLNIQYIIHRFLAYSGINTIGFLLIALLSPLQFNYILFFLVSYSISLIALTIIINSTSSNPLISRLSTPSPLFTFLFAFHLFSILGLPPLLGFFPKFFILNLYLSLSLYPIIIFFIFTSLLSSFAYLSIIQIILFNHSPNFIISRYNPSILLSLTFIIILTPLLIF